MRFTVLSLIIGTAIAGTSSQHGHGLNASTTDYKNLTVAIVRAPPANWPLPVMNKNWTGVEFNLNATIDKAVNLIGQAADAGANLVVFPELWFPGHVWPFGHEIKMILNT